MIVIGLTGSIGMGKSTVADFFRERGVPVFDADAAVHRIYEGEAAPIVERFFPGTVEGGKVNREALSERVADRKELWERLESVVHSIVCTKEREFLDEASERGARMVALDIPLLFETGAFERVDKVIVVSASPEEQRRRVLGREGMSERKFNAILSRQLPDEEKRRRADFVIDTSFGLEETRRQALAALGEASGEKAPAAGKG